MSVTAKTIVTTAASSGFEEGAVRAFPDLGYRVWGTMRDVNGRDTAKRAAIKAQSSGITSVEMDVTRDASATEAFAHIHGKTACRRK